MKQLILLLACCNLFASEQIGDWFYTHESKNGTKFSAAGTKDQYNSQLFMICYNDGKTDCMTVVNLNLDCANGSSYPILVSHVNGSQSLEAHCATVFGHKMLNLPEQEQHIVNGSIYSVVIAKESGKFKSAHFSLKGSAKAYQKMIIDVGRLANAGNIL